MSFYQESIFLKAIPFTPLTRCYRLVKPSALMISALTLLLFQIFDALLTYHGVARYGVEVEGNPVVLIMMQQFGIVGGLFLSKLLASLLLLFVVVSSQRITWVPYALTGVCGVYLVAAVIPWITLFNIA